MENIDAISALAALAQETRLAAFRLLVRHEPAGLAAGELARLLDVPQNTLSTHLGLLARADLVTSSRDGRIIRYRARLDSVQALVLFLLTDCCQGEAALCGSILTALSAPACFPKSC